MILGEDDGSYRFINYNKCPIPRGRILIKGRPCMCVCVGGGMLEVYGTSLYLLLNFCEPNIAFKKSEGD